MTDSDRMVLRELASRWMEVAGSPEMQETKRLWKAVKDLRAERPVILAETFPISGFFDEKKLVCRDGFLRNVERTLRESLEHYEDVGDDIVLEPYFRLAWQVTRSTYGEGMALVEEHAQDTAGRDLGYTYEFGIKTPDDVERLEQRTYRVNREYTQQCRRRCEDIFGDILPVRVGNYDNFSPDSLGYNPFLGNNFIGISMDTYKLMGNENLNLWPYDHPDKLHAVASYMCEDRIAFYTWLEQENLLDYNTDNQFAGPSSYGYVSDLPSVDSDAPARLKDVWAWPESQETTVMSPAMYGEFFLPYIAKVSSLFGMTYYGCCEPLVDRLDRIMEAIPNLRAVSVSGWNNYGRMGDILGTDYVYSCKPKPAPISGAVPDWDAAREDMEATYQAAKNCNLEIIYRDVYDINGERDRIREWVEMTKSVLGF